LRTVQSLLDLLLDLLVLDIFGDIFDILLQVSRLGDLINIIDLKGASEGH
jgi:hypothetical protein